mmetsp:Transcript_98868/g.235763  ORF Transcript_98868/g.235763 Transcript_98868/m.235763 type:complete len:223 (-) Transcript_98868:3403-4071(-)
MHWHREAQPGEAQPRRAAPEQRLVHLAPHWGASQRPPRRAAASQEVSLCCFGWAVVIGSSQPRSSRRLRSARRWETPGSSASRGGRPPTFGSTRWPAPSPAAGPQRRCRSSSALSACRPARAAPSAHPPGTTLAGRRRWAPPLGRRAPRSRWDIRRIAVPPPQGAARSPTWSRAHRPPALRRCRPERTTAPPSSSAAAASQALSRDGHWNPRRPRKGPRRRR